MRTSILIVLLLGSLVGWAQLSRLSVSGNQIIDEEGQVYVFQGVSIADPDKLQKNNRWNQSLFAEAKKWGVNLIRIPIHPPRWRDRGQEGYLELLDQAVSWANELGLYLVFDWHSIGNLRSEMFFLPIYETSQKETFDFWRLMSTRYGNEPAVAFFELYNEPTTFNGRLGICTWAQWKDIMEELIVIVRANGAQAIPLVAGFNWAYSLKEVAQQPIDAEGIAYVSHPYPQKREKPWADKWEADWGFVARDYPVLLTEIGFCGPDDKGAHVPVISDESYGDELIAFTQARGISYVAWVFDPDWSPMMFSDWDFTPTRQGKYWKKAWQKK